MRNFLIGAAMMGAALAGAPAEAAANIECMDDGYSAADEKVFQDFFANFTVASMNQEGASDAYTAPIATRAANCALSNGWNEAAITNAIFYRMSVMLAAALELKSPLTKDQMTRLEDTIAKADQARLRAILGPGIEASMNSQSGPELSEEDTMYLGLVVIGAGLPQDDGIGEYVGALLGARMMAEIAAEKFAQS